MGNNGAAFEFHVPQSPSITFTILLQYRRPRNYEKEPHLPCTVVMYHRIVHNNPQRMQTYSIRIDPGQQTFQDESQLLNVEQTHNGGLNTSVTSLAEELRGLLSNPNPFPPPAHPIPQVKSCVTARPGNNSSSDYSQVKMFSSV